MRGSSGKLITLLAKPVIKGPYVLKKKKQTQVKKLGFFCVRLVTVFSSVLNFYFFLSGSFFWNNLKV